MSSFGRNHDASMDRWEGMEEDLTAGLGYEVVEESLHFIGGVSVACALGDGKSFFEPGDGFFGAA